MKKKKIIIIIISIFIIIALFPEKHVYKDGGSIGYSSPIGLYEITNWNTMEGGRGTTVEVLGKEVYDSFHYE